MLKEIAMEIIVALIFCTNKVHKQQMPHLLGAL